MTLVRPNFKDKVINAIQMSVWALTCDNINDLLKHQRPGTVVKFIPEIKNNITEMLVIFSDLQYYSHENKLTL
jgi:hypothetical protein